MNDQVELFSQPQTLLKARQGLLKKLSEEREAECPCCGNRVKVYRRHLNRAMVKALVWLVYEHEKWPQRWFHISELPTIQGRPGGGDFAKLAHWGLINEKPNEDDGKKTSGLWKPTFKAFGFVTAGQRVPAWVELLENRPTAWSEETVDVFEAFGEEFDYRKIAELQR